MANSRDRFLTRSKYDVWYYQRWLPKHLCRPRPSRKSLFKLSLRTKDKKKAQILGRFISVEIDKLILLSFQDAEVFGKGMELLYADLKATQENDEWEAFEEDFLLKLDEYEQYLLSKSRGFYSDVTSQINKLKKEITDLRIILTKFPANQNSSINEELLERLQNQINPPLSDEENPLLTDLSRKWFEQKKGRMSPSSLETNYMPAIELFIKIVDDYKGGDGTRIQQLSPDHIRHYKQIYKKIPKRASCKDKSVTQITHLKGDPKSAKTIKDNFTNIGTFLEWARIEGYPVDTRLIDILRKDTEAKVSDKDRKRRVPLSDEDLAKLFNSKKYREGSFKSSGMYWAGLIALFTGARMAEIIQLEKSDIVKNKEIWVIKFDDLDTESVDKYKRLKQSSSRRVVPIHKTLLKLGFIDYVKTKEDRLFPDEHRHNKTQKFDAFQKRFSRYRRECGVIPNNDNELRDFHSFRHTVRTRLSEARFDGGAKYYKDIIDSILGHSSKDRSEGDRTYDHAELTKQKKKAVNKLTYESIDFDSIKSWNKCDFYRKPYREKTRHKLRKK